MYTFVNEYYISTSEFIPEYSEQYSSLLIL